MRYLSFTGKLEYKLELSLDKLPLLMKFCAIVSITLCLVYFLLIFFFFFFDKRSLTRQLQVGQHKRRLKNLVRINYLIRVNKLPIDLQTVDATFPRQRVFVFCLPCWENAFNYLTYPFRRSMLKKSFFKGETSNNKTLIISKLLSTISR